MPAAALARGASKPRRASRIVHLCDAHVPANGQNDRVAKALGVAQSCKPDLIVFGGDNISGADFESDPIKVEAQFNNFCALRDAAIKCKHASVLGRRDVWGLDAPAPADPRRGAAFALQAYAMPARYYSLELKGWRMLLLDSWFEGTCHIDAEQLSWLEIQLANQKPTVIVSHAPMLTVAGFLETTSKRSGSWSTSNSMAIANSFAVRQILETSGCVRLVVSGGAHIHERIELNGISYCTDGAVSGAWWSGSHCGFSPALTQIDLFDNGTFERKVIEWEAPQRTEHEE